MYRNKTTIKNKYNKYKGNKKLEQHANKRITK
jgi:hypothetical protein